MIDAKLVEIRKLKPTASNCIVVYVQEKLVFVVAAVVVVVLVVVVAAVVVICNHCETLETTIQIYPPTQNIAQHNHNLAPCDRKGLLQPTSMAGNSWS